MHLLSYLDPVMDLEYVERFLVDIQNFLETKDQEVEKSFKEWDEGAKKDKKLNEEYYQNVVDLYVDEAFFVSELQKNLLNGLAVTINSVFERHLSFFVISMAKIDSRIKYRETHTYHMDEFFKMLKQVKHPNVDKLDQKLLKRLQMYMEIRNCIVHKGGYISEKSTLRPFVSSNKNLFDNRTWHIGIKAFYIKLVLEDLKEFFKLLAYYDDGRIVYN
jgi:hypothetical protein